MRYSDDFEVVCNYTMPMVELCNESDEQLKRHRAEAGEEGYDAFVSFQVFIGHYCVDFEFNLYGLDMRYTFRRTDDAHTRAKVYVAAEIACQWFADKTLDDISEKMYKDIENELGKKIFEKIKGI